MQVNFYVFFSVCYFNTCIVQSFVSNSCLKTAIVPICKNKNRSMTDTSNYRPVAVATVVSKLLEHFISSSTVFPKLWYAYH